jgi:hypothetical protein
MLKYLSAQDVDLGSRAQRLYDETIDLGAHPNPDAVALAYGQEELTDGSGFEHGMNYLAGEGFGLMVALKTATDVGILSIAVVSCAFPSYARDLGVLQEVEELTKRVQGE